MRSLILAAAFFNLFSVTSVHASPEFRVKDGRTYVFDLARRVGIPPVELLKKFNGLRQNMPADGSMNAFSSGADSLAKVAAIACSELSSFDDNKGIENLYRTILDRQPIAEEKSKVIRDVSGKFSYFANCMVLALSPEFITFK